jgi:glycosyltransferase involved in cell wall biosynthesis
MNILMIASGYPPDFRGGGEISTQFLAECLAEQGQAVTVLSAARKERHEYIKGVAVHRIPSPNIDWNFHETRSAPNKLIWHAGDNWNPRARSLVRREIEEVRPDIVVTSTIENFGGEAWRAAHDAGVPVVHILRSYFLLCWQGSMFKRGQNCARPCVECRIATVGRRAAIRHLDGVVGITRFILKAHQDAGLFASQAAQGQTVILPDPVMEVSAARSGEHQSRFGFLGMLTPNKGVERLLETWAIARPPGAVLSIAGTGQEDYVASLKALAPEGVEFVGWVPSNAFLDTIDFLIVPSVWNEPFGRIVVEAFSRGVPVLGSRTGGIPELIEVGRTGELFDSSEASLLGAIDRAVGMDSAAYRQMSLACVEAARRYLPDQLSEEYLAYFEAVIRQHKDARRSPVPTD